MRVVRLEILFKINSVLIVIRSPYKNLEHFKKNDLKLISLSNFNPTNKKPHS
jgi:hypothetical protein